MFAPITFLMFVVVVAQFKNVESLKVVNCNFSCSVLRDLLAAASPCLKRLHLSSLACKGTMDYAQGLHEIKFLGFFCCFES